MPKRIPLTEVPERMRSLRMDAQGYPVPWFIVWSDGKPLYPSCDVLKLTEALLRKLCWVCGDPLGSNLCFIASPMSGVNRVVEEPPCHRDCATWCAKNLLKANVSVTMLWITRGYVLIDSGANARPALVLGEPEAVEFYWKGKPILYREIIMADVDQEWPKFVEVAANMENGDQLLADSREKFLQLLKGAGIE